MSSAPKLIMSVAVIALDKGRRRQGRENADICGIAIDKHQFTQPYVNAGACRSYLTQCRKETGQRLVDKCFDTETAPSKYWMAFAQKKFLNKILT